MEIFEEIKRRGHEQILFHYDRASGLKAIIAIHNTTLGPALGGCRMLPYQTEEAALEDALRLSEGMTYKAAAAGLDFGGGKTVIIGDPLKDKSEALFRALGRFIETLKGRYLTGEDVGTTEEDFVWARRETRYVVGLPPAYGGSGDTGDNTARGVIQAMRAALMHRYGSPDLQGRRIAVQGLGKVGYHVVRRAIEAGARVIAADINPHVVGRVASAWGIEATDPWAVVETPCDIFAPCALGNVITERTVSALQCQVVAGSANNQLADDRLADDLAARGILYAPDFIANAGGLIQVADEIRGYHEERVHHQIDGIYDVLLEIFRKAEASGRSTVAVAVDEARRRLDTIQAIHRLYRT